MKSKKQSKLVLITQRFPYFPGEQFLETEIKYLSEGFDEIYIIPTSVSGKDAEKRELPGNVYVYPIYNINSPILRSLNRVVPLLFDSRVRNLFFKDFKLAKEKRALHILMNWLGLALRTRNHLETLSNKIDFKECIFYSYWLNPAALALTMFKQKEKQTVIVSRAHGGDLYEYRHSLRYLPLQLNTIRQLDKLFLISNDGVQYLTGKYPNISDRLLVSRLGTLKFGEKAEKPNDGIFKIVTCSYLRPVKRVGLLVEALKQCKSKIKWTHIGEGPLRKQIEEQAQELQDNISWELLGGIPNDKVLEYYQNQSVDLFVNVSESEGIPVTFMEVMSCGIPVMATNVGGVSELVNDQNGVLLDKDVSPSELARQIDQFVELSTEEKEQLGSNALQTWNQSFNAEVNYTEFVKTLKQIGEQTNYA